MTEPFYILIPGDISKTSKRIQVTPHEAIISNNLSPEDVMIVMGNTMKSIVQYEDIDINQLFKVLHQD